MKIVTMGEMILRLMPKNNLRFEQATEFESYYGGDESIVAVSLAKMGMETRYVTKLPVNPIANVAIGNLREQNVDTSCIVRGGERKGLNFYENGASVRASNVVYDRNTRQFRRRNPMNSTGKRFSATPIGFTSRGLRPRLAIARRSW